MESLEKAAEGNEPGHDLQEEQDRRWEKLEACGAYGPAGGSKMAEGCSRGAKAREGTKGWALQGLASQDSGGIPHVMGGHKEFGTRR